MPANKTIAPARGLLTLFMMYTGSSVSCVSSTCALSFDMIEGGEFVIDLIVLLSLAEVCT